MSSTYTTRTEAIQAEILDPISAGAVDDAVAEYDIDAIAAEVIGDYSQGYACQVDEAAFWAIVEKHARPTSITVQDLATELGVTVDQVDEAAYDVLAVHLIFSDEVWTSDNGKQYSRPVVTALEPEGADYIRKMLKK